MKHKPTHYQGYTIHWTWFNGLKTYGTVEPMPFAEDECISASVYRDYMRNQPLGIVLERPYTCLPGDRWDVTLYVAGHCVGVGNYSSLSSAKKGAVRSLVRIEEALQFAKDSED